MGTSRKTIPLVKRTHAPVAFKQYRKTLLPYNRNSYIHYLGSDADSHTPWYGVSFQLASEAHHIRQGISFGLPKFIEHYEPLFKHIISTFDEGSYWVVTHDKHTLEWLPNDEPTVPALRTLFAQHRVPNDFKGAILLAKQEVLTLARELLSYPGGIFSREESLYSNIDVSHSKLPFVIKISDHLNVDFLSTDKALLRTVVDENRSPVFTIKPYTGTSL